MSAGARSSSVELWSEFGRSLIGLGWSLIGFGQNLIEDVQKVKFDRCCWSLIGLGWSLIDVCRRSLECWSLIDVCRSSIDACRSSIEFCRGLIGLWPEIDRAGLDRLEFCPTELDRTMSELLKFDRIWLKFDRCLPELDRVLSSFGRSLAGV